MLNPKSLPLLFLFTALSICRETIIKSKVQTSRQDILIAFGNDYTNPDVIQSDVMDQLLMMDPDAFLFLGDPPFKSKFPSAAINQLPTSVHVNGVFYPEYKDDFDEVYDFIKENPDSMRRKNKHSSYSTLLIKVDSKQFPVAPYVKIIMLDLYLEEKNLQYELQFLEREFISDKSILLYIVASNRQIFSMGKMFADEDLDHDLRMKLIGIFSRVEQPMLFVSTTYLGPFGEIINWPCVDSGRKIVEISSNGLNTEGDGTILKDLYDLLLPETLSSKKNRVYDNNFGSVEVILDRKNLENSFVVIKILSEKSKTLLTQTLKFSELKRDPKKIQNDFGCSREMSSTFKTAQIWNILLNPATIMMFLFPLSLLLRFCIPRMMNSEFYNNGGFGGAVSEYERFHMD